MRLPTPLIKVCGVTREADIDMLAAAGVNAIGLNFVATSPRVIDFDRAGRLLAIAEARGLCRIAVVMDPSAAELSLLLRELPFDYLQLHGSELPGLLRAVDWSAVKAPRGIIKAISWSGRAEEARLAAAWRQAGAPPTPPLSAFLVDAYAPSQGGGTGRLARWDLLVPRPPELTGIPLILAGGLDPRNVAAGVSTVRPEGVDTASGVEISAGLKCADLAGSFACSAQAAFAR